MLDSAIVAALVSTVIVLTEVVKHFVKQRSDTKAVVDDARVVVDHEMTRQVRETYEEMKLMKKDIVEIVNNENELARTLASIAEILRRTADTQDKVTRMLEKIDRRQDVEDEIRRRRVGSVD